MHFDTGRHHNQDEAEMRKTQPKLESEPIPYEEAEAIRVISPLIQKAFGNLMDAKTSAESRVALAALEAIGVAAAATSPKSAAKLAEIVAKIRNDERERQRDTCMP